MNNDKFIVIKTTDRKRKLIRTNDILDVLWEQDAIHEPITKIIHKNYEGKIIEDFVYYNVNWVIDVIMNVSVGEKQFKDIGK